MKYLLTLALFLSLAHADGCREFLPQTASQHHELISARAYGTRHNMKDTFMAIDGQESSYNEEPANLISGCYGPMHIRLHDYMKLHDIPRTYTNQKNLVNRLLYDRKFAYDAARENLTHWVKKYTRHGRTSWKKVWASYFAGNNWEAGIEYANNIKRRIKCLHEHGY